MSVYRFALTLKTVSDHIIKYLLTEFSGVSGENIWLWVMKQGPRCARYVDHDPEPNNFPSGPSTQSIRTQYFGFVRHTFIAHDVIEHKKWKCYSFFNRKCQALVFTPLKGLIFITRSITVQPKFLFFNAKLSLRDNRLIVLVNFSFSSGCDLHNRSQNTKKTKWLYFDLAHHTFLTNDGF